MLRRLIGSLFLLFVLALLPAGVVYSQGEVYPDPEDQVSIAAVMEDLEHQGCNLVLTNVEYNSSRDEFHLTDNQSGGTVEVDCPADRKIVSFEAIDWDTVMADQSKWTTAVFTYTDGSSWLLSTTMADDERRTVSQGDQSSTDLVIEAEDGQPTSANFVDVVKIHIQPGIHRTGDRFDSTWFGLEIAKLPDEPVCISVNKSKDLITETGEEVTVTIKADNADEYRVVHVSDGVPVVTGTTNTLTYTAIPEVDYQGQVRRDGGEWTNEGCLFAFTKTPPKPPALCEGLDLNPSSGPTPLTTTAEVAQTNGVSMTMHWGDGNILPYPLGVFSATHAFTETGTYTVSAVVWNVAGEASTSSACIKELEVKEKPPITEPMACQSAILNEPFPEKGLVEGQTITRTLSILPSNAAEYHLLRNGTVVTTSVTSVFEYGFTAGEYEVHINKVGEKPSPCKVGVIPTGLDPIDQPPLPDQPGFPFRNRLPSVLNHQD